MVLNLFKSKIHRATVTEANLNYMGSITIDEALMEKAHILPNERVQVVDNNNGARLETYQPGDTVIIMAYAWMDEAEAKSWKPTVVMVDEKNRPVEVRDVEYHGQTE